MDKEMQRMAEMVAAQISPMKAEALEHDNGHLQFRLQSGGVVNWWPFSQRRTANSPQLGTRRKCSAEDVAAMLVEVGASAENPNSGSEKPNSGNRAADTGKPKQSKGFPNRKTPGICRHHYTGERPPWEYPTKIMCQSDRMRLVAYRLKAKAVSLWGQAQEQDEVIHEG